MKTFATVSRFIKVEEAHLLRSRLEAAGIPAFVRDEFTVQADWLLSTALGGVRVDVARSHWEAAQEIVQLPAPDPLEEEALSCPRCGSTEVIQREVSRDVAYASLLILPFPVPLPWKHLRCPRCRFSWH